MYKFVCDPDALFNMTYGNGANNEQFLSKTSRQDLQTNNTSTPVTNRTQDNNKHSHHHHLAYSEVFNLYNCGFTHPNPYPLHSYLPDSTTLNHHKRYNAI